MTEITDAEAAEILWANSERGKAAFKAAWGKLHAMGLHKHVDATQLGQIVYAAHLATAADPGTVYLATAGEYSDYRVVHAFARREDAEAYKLGDEVKEMPVHDGPVEVRRWYDLDWRASRADRASGQDWIAVPNPHVTDELRDFDGNEKLVQHTWSGTWLNVQGWDLALVKKVYGEQRGQYLARKEGIT
jgi:hypothetical protein